MNVLDLVCYLYDDVAVMQINAVNETNGFISLLNDFAIFVNNTNVSLSRDFLLENIQVVKALMWYHKTAKEKNLTSDEASSNQLLNVIWKDTQMNNVVVFFNKTIMPMIRMIPQKTDPSSNQPFRLAYFSSLTGVDQQILEKLVFQIMNLNITLLGPISAKDNFSNYLQNLNQQKVIDKNKRWFYDELRALNSTNDSAVINQATVSYEDFIVGCEWLGQSCTFNK
jgi:hypothetical protein